MTKTILIADDESGVVKILGLWLEANGYNVIGVNDGPRSQNSHIRKNLI